MLIQILIHPDTVFDYSNMHNECYYIVFGPKKTGIPHLDSLGRILSGEECTKAMHVVEALAVNRKILIGNRKQGLLYSITPKGGLEGNFLYAGVCHIDK